jgi:hypothetical protein
MTGSDGSEGSENPLLAKIQYSSAAAAAAPAMHDRNISTIPIHFVSKL